MKKATLTIVAALCASIVLADDFKTIDGKEYKNAKVSRVEPDGLVLMTKSGISKVYFTELPKEVQERYHYNPQEAAEFTAQSVERNRQFLQQRATDGRKQAEEREKYWSENATPQPVQESTTLGNSALDKRAYGQSAGSITPQYLAAEYARSEIRADELYKGRLFSVSGIVKSVSKSGSEAGVELYIPYSGGSGTVKWFVCFFQNPGEVASQRVGNPISLTGTVSGMNGNTLVMQDCHL
jgi:hypothetical protein